MIAPEGGSNGGRAYIADLELSLDAPRGFLDTYKTQSYDQVATSRFEHLVTEDRERDRP